MSSLTFLEKKFRILFAAAMIEWHFRGYHSCELILLIGHNSLSSHAYRDKFDTKLEINWHNLILLFIGHLARPSMGSL